MNKLITLIALVLAPSISANPIPSTISGTYVGSGNTLGWTCEVRAFQFSNDGGIGFNRALSTDCLTPGPRKSGAVSLYNPCPDETTAPPLVPWGVPCGPAPDYCVPPGLPRFSIVSSSPATTACSLGEIQVVISGVQSRMCRTQIIVTPSYPGCNPTTIPTAKPKK